MAAEVNAAAIAIGAALRSQKKIQLLVDNKAVCSQLRRTIREGGAAPRKPKACAGLWNLVSATRKGLLNASWCSSHGKRPEWKCELPTSTEAARNLNDKGDTAAGAASAKVKQEVEVGEDKIKEDIMWAQRALQIVVKQYNEFVDHIGLETNNHSAVMRWVT